MNAPVPVAVWASLLVITTSFTPAVPAGVTAVIWVASTLVTLVAATLPIVTPNEPPDTKFEPVIVTGVPPAVGPELGKMVLNVRASRGDIRERSCPGCCLGVIVGYHDVLTPAVPAGVTAVIWVASTLTTLDAATLPIVTPNEPPDTKFEPVIVTGVPPAVGPELGKMVLNVGAGRGDIRECSCPGCCLGVIVGYHDVLSSRSASWCDCCNMGGVNPGDARCCHTTNSHTK